MDILELIAKTQAISFTDAIGDEIAAHPEHLTQAQREQMTAGKTSGGDLIGKYASQAYAARKFRLSSKAGFGNVDLRLTRDFQNDIFALTDEQGVILSSYDAKLMKLTDQYGDERIFGLSPEYMAAYSINILEPAVNGRLILKIHG